MRRVRKKYVDDNFLILFLPTTENSHYCGQFYQIKTVHNFVEITKIVIRHFISVHYSKCINPCRGESGPPGETVALPVGSSEL